MTTKKGNRPLFRTNITQAVNGLRLAYRTEKSFRLQIWATALLVVVIFWLPLAAWERSLLLLVAMVILVLELLNSSVERLVDLIKPRLHEHVGEVKDVMAGAVLLASLFSLVFALLILGPHFLSLLDTL
jgi:diacylglycerol kinase